MEHTELRGILTDLGLSQAQFARDVGVSRRAVVHWASAKRRIPARVVALLRRAKRRGYWPTR